MAINFYKLSIDKRVKKLGFCEYGLDYQQPPFGRQSVRVLLTENGNGAALWFSAIKLINWGDRMFCPLAVPVLVWFFGVTR
ncbi:hypothetical protein CRP01_28355 [Flavilitoribacter nigricans DSM 23189 = NBRC 102662]|uniref:Uncharacterized protein n=1 Tax=Flavilitoribacter nigricans (strain ATCC 23147 / DSM 23189 / NBRC 102662 / NCIMB 1420 / SS-2) TaxID=1122177 RepID=A0A2D0N4D7_FLAN2|nr:hypothetical protein CRP01_28355 [Flavilitoribacter nigricans DSM 23189 = NBRC 102662]